MPRRHRLDSTIRPMGGTALAAGLLLCACDALTRPEPPEEVYLEIRYSALGWSPDRSAWYFVKELRERRGYVWVKDYLDPSRWSPEVTAVSAVVCAVGADGTGLRELYAIPDLPAGIEWHYTAVTADERVVAGQDRSLYILGPDGSRQLADVPRKIGWLDHSAARSAVVVGDGETGLHLLDTVDGARRRLTGGRDRHPRWSPDGRRLLFLRWHEDGTADFVLLDADTGEERQVLQKPLRRGLFHDGVVWDGPSTIRVGNAYLSEPWPLEDGLAVHPLGAPDACAVDEDRALVSAPDCAGERPGRYGHFGRMGPAGVFGVDNVTGTVKLLAVEDFRPVVFDPRWPGSGAVSEGPRCHVRSLFCLDGRWITISNDESWEQEVGALRGPDGRIW